MNRPVIDVPARNLATNGTSGARSTGLLRLWHWLLNDARAVGPLDEATSLRIDPMRAIPFVAIHLACLGVLWVGVSGVAVGVALVLYAVRMFAVTAFFHRYFSHRAFKVSRPMQFAMALLGCTAGQRGPVWWAAHHREHHLSSDTPNDPHSPLHRGLWFSHTLWFLTRGAFATPERRVRDLLRFPELRVLEALDWLPFVTLGLGCYALGAWLEGAAPGFGTDGPQMLVWGFFVSTVALYHATYTINSLAHTFGQRRYDTPDSSRNNALLALVTLGEGWHNNHHHYPAAARQGFFWWELDVSWLGLRALRALGLVSELKTVPARILAGEKR